MAETGFKPTTSRLWIQCSNHCPARPHSVIEQCIRLKRPVKSLETRCCKWLRENKLCQCHDLGKPCIHQCISQRCYNFNTGFHRLAVQKITMLFRYFTNDIDVKRVDKLHHLNKFCIHWSFEKTKTKDIGVILNADYDFIVLPGNL